MTFFPPPSSPPSFLCNIHHLPEKKEEKRGLEQEKGGAQRHNAWLELWSPGISDASTELLSSRPISSPPIHLPFFLSLRLEVATAAQLSALVMEGRRANVMRSDRVLFENPVQLGHWGSQVCLFCTFVRISTEWGRERERLGVNIGNSRVGTN